MQVNSPAGGTSAAAKKQSFASVPVLVDRPGFEMRETFKVAKKPRKELPVICRGVIGDSTGAVYVNVKKGKAGKITTKELVKGRVFADFDRRGGLVGVEVIR